MRSAPLFIPIALLTACNAVLGLDERPSRDTPGSGGTTSTTSTDGAMGCADCLQDPPDGWSGPVLLSSGGSPDDLAGCGESYPNEVLSLQRELRSDAHDCPCTCSEATGITCTVSVTSWDNNSCGNELRVDTFSSVGQCIDIANSTDSVSYPAPIVDTSAASCAPSGGTPVIPEVTWGHHARACGPVTGIDAVPAGFDACIYQTGDVACPADHYTERTLWHGDVDDTRACENDCSCGAITGVDCGIALVAWHDHDCSEAPPGAILQAPGCITGTYDSVRLDSLSPTGSCEPGVATPTGDLVPTDPTTVCCAG